MEREILFYKENEGDTIWQVFDGTCSGPMISFNKKKILYLYSDYPYKFTKKQIEIFRKEMPYWAEYFSYRIITETIDLPVFIVN